MSEKSLLDEETEIASGEGISVSANEIKAKRSRGRPPGSGKAKAVEKEPPNIESLSLALENAIKGIFAIAGLAAGWFGYEQTEDLTDSEVKEGAKAFAPIAAKVPWFGDAAIWLGAPVWLLITMRKKFVRKGNAPNSNGASGDGAVPSNAGSRETAANG